RSVFRFEFNSLLVAGDGLVQLLLVGQGVAEVVPSKAASRAECPRDRVMPERCFRTLGANRRVEPTQLVMGAEVRRTHLPAPLQKRDGLGESVMACQAY